MAFQNFLCCFVISTLILSSIIVEAQPFEIPVANILPINPKGFRIAIPG